MGPGGFGNGVLTCTADVIAELLGASFGGSLHGGLCFSTPLPLMLHNLRLDVRQSILPCWVLDRLVLCTYSRVILGHGYITWKL